MTDSSPDAEMGGPSPREIDTERAQGWLTRAEAYLLVSKVKRVQTACLNAMLSLAEGDRSTARRYTIEAHEISKELNPLLDSLIYSEADEPHGGN